MNKLLNLIKQLTGLYRSKTWHLFSGTSGERQFNVRFTGTEIQKNFIKRVLFPQDAEERDLGVCYFWHLRQLTNQPVDYDLVVMEQHQTEASPATDNTSWFLPYWLQLSVDLPIGKLKNSYKQDLRLIKRHQLEYSITTDQSLITHFYEDMYTPYIHQRHGDTSITMDRNEYTDTLNNDQCELLLVSHEQQPIAGMVIDYRGLMPNLWSIGVLDGDRRYLDLAAVPACYHFCYVYLESKGYSQVSLGFTRPFINDGVFKFKRKFNCGISHAVDRGFVLYPQTNAAALNQWLAENPFVYEDGMHLSLASFQAETEFDQSLSKSVLKEYKNLGLRKVQNFCKNNAEFVAGASIDLQPHESQYPQSDTDDNLEAHGRDAAMYLLRHLMQARLDTRLLLYADHASDSTTTTLIQQVAESIGLEVVVLNLPQQLSVAEQSDLLIKTMGEHSFDLLCETSGQYFYNTPSWQEAEKLGIRAFSLGALNLESFVRCVGEVNHFEVHERAAKIGELLKAANTIRIVDENGTDLQVGMKRPLANKVLAKLKIQPTLYARVNKPTGIMTQTTNATFLGGQLSFLGLTPSISGKLVIDAYFWPPDQLGPLNNAVTLTLSQGTIVDIAGGDEAEKLKRWLPDAPWTLEHICIGMNPGAQLGRGIMEAERASGVCNFGFCVAPFHTDGIISAPTLTVDDKVLIERGKFTDWQ